MIVSFVDIVKLAKNIYYSYLKVFQNYSLYAYCELKYNYPNIKNINNLLDFLQGVCLLVSKAYGYLLN